MRLSTAAIALAIGLTACVAGPRQPSPTGEVTVATTIPATTTTTLSVVEAVRAFQDCLADRGVSVVEVPFDSEGRPRLELAFSRVDFADRGSVVALSECAGLLSDGALDLSVWPNLREMVQASLEAFSECVRSHGVLTFPDPVRLFSGVGGPYPLEEIPYDAPGLGAAIEVCAERLVEG